jgi:chaperone required for assembly of F1-ATPase
MKRFYKSVSLTEETTNGYGLLLDNKPVQTPARQLFYIKSKDIAAQIVKEWEEQTENILPLTMPISQMAMTLMDRVIPFREKLEEEILGYIDTDLICYRTDEPEQYKKVQEQKWNPFIQWFEKKFNLKLDLTYGLSPLTQSESIHLSIQKYRSSITDEEMMALYLTTLGTGSIILGLAFLSKDFTVEDILEAAFAEEKLKDEIYLSEFYGSAPDQERKYKTLSQELETLLRFIT